MVAVRGAEPLADRRIGSFATNTRARARSSWGYTLTEKRDAEVYDR
jgi:hypothetical protein